MLNIYSNKLNVLSQIKIFGKLNKYHINQNHLEANAFNCQHCNDICEDMLNDFLYNSRMEHDLMNNDHIQTPIKTTNENYCNLKSSKCVDI